MTIHRTSSGKIARGSGGKIQRAPSQADFETCCCSSSAPCTDCSGTQDSPVVSVTGSCHVDCTDEVAGTYDYVSFSSGTCMWTYKFPPNDRTILRISYDSTTEKWSAYINCWSFSASFQSTDVSGISCVGGKLTGRFSLLGTDRTGEGWVDCSGCTANVSL